MIHIRRFVLKKREGATTENFFNSIITILTDPYKHYNMNSMSMKGMETALKCSLRLWTMQY